MKISIPKNYKCLRKVTVQTASLKGQERDRQCSIQRKKSGKYVLKTSQSTLGSRIIESLRLEKTSKIIKSNCQPITTVSRSVMSTCFLNTSRDSDSTTSLGSLFQCFTSLSVKNFFLICNLNLP